MIVLLLTPECSPRNPLLKGRMQSQEHEQGHLPAKESPLLEPLFMTR